MVLGIGGLMLGGNIVISRLGVRELVFLISTLIDLIICFLYLVVCWGGGRTRTRNED